MSIGNRLFGVVVLGGMGVTFFMLANAAGGVLAGFGYVFGVLLSLIAVMQLFGPERRK